MLGLNSARYRDHRAYTVGAFGGIQLDLNGRTYLKSLLILFPACHIWALAADSGVTELTQIAAV